MRAVWYERNGPAREVLKVGELSAPSPGPGEVRTDPEPKRPFYKLMVRNLTLRWVYVYELPRASLDAAYRDIAAWLISGTAHQRIARIFELDAAADAHGLVEAAPLGKVLIKIGGEELQT